MNMINIIITKKGRQAMKNRGKRAALALLLLSGCVQEDLSIVGVEPGQPGPESG